MSNSETLKKINREKSSPRTQWIFWRILTSKN